MVHIVGPAFVVADYLLLPPPCCLSLAQAATWLVFPSVWLAYTMLRGPSAEWYPCSFDPHDHGAGEIAATCVAIFAAPVLIGSALRWWAGRDGSAGRRGTNQLTPTDRCAGPPVGRIVTRDLDELPGSGDSSDERSADNLAHLVNEGDDRCPLPPRPPALEQAKETSVWTTPPRRS